MKIYLILLSSIYFFCSCNNKKSETPKIKESKANIFPGYVAKSVTDSLIDRAINLNDTIAYNNAETDYLMQNNGESFLYYSMIMAYKNGYAHAYYDVYEIIAYSTQLQEPKGALPTLGKKTKSFAIYHLLKSYEMGYSDAIFDIEDLFGSNKKIPPSSVYLKEYSEN